LANSLTDTSKYKTSWDLCNQTDTIGKYYRMENSDNYMMCLLDIGRNYDFETHLIIEVTSNGKLVKSERFFHGNYACCWNNDYKKGFSKYGDFFGIEICGTGSGHCSSWLHLFKEITPQDSIFPIPFECWSSYEELFGRFSSLNIEIKKDELEIYYVSESGTYEYNEKNKDFDFKIDSTEKFSIKYFYENGKWDTKDKENLEKLEQCCYF
jgi:hypothetical protein